MEHVQTKSAVGLPMVHRLEGDQRQPPVDGELRQGGIQHTMRPAPDDLPHKHFREIFGLDLRQQDDVAAGDQLFTGPDSTHEFGQLAVVNAIALGIAVLNVHPLT